MVLLPLPQIDHVRCCSCGLYVDACSTLALGQLHEKAYLQDVAACTNCASCEDICLEDAIARPFLVVLAIIQNQMSKSTGKGDMYGR